MTRVFPLIAALAMAGVPQNCFGASVEASDEPEELSYTLSIPLQDGQLELGQLLGDLTDAAGFDGEAVRQRIDWRIEVASPSGQVQLFAIQSITRRIMVFETRPDRLVVRVDRLQLRREEKRLRSALRLFFEQQFPKAAAAAKARYGITIHDGKQPVQRLEDVALVDDVFKKRRVIVLVHGLDDPGKVWNALRPALRAAGYVVCEFDYPNDQPIADSTRLLIEHLARLRSHGVTRISIVAHSMGGLVSRDVLTNRNGYAGRGTGHASYPDIDRLIMVGTPNHGSELARLRLAAEIRDQIAHQLSGKGVLFGSIFDGAGEAKIDLLPDSEFLTALNGRPHPQNVAMTIIAGRVSPVTSGKIRSLARELRSQHPNKLNRSVDDITNTLNGLVDGFGDGVVTLESTRLDGVDDHVTVEGSHLSMILNVRDKSQRVPPAVPIILNRLNPTSRPAE